MTREEIQAVIDKGGVMVLKAKDPDYVVMPVRYEHGVITGFFHYKGGQTFMGQISIMFTANDWREATPEEIEKYVTHGN